MEYQLERYKLTHSTSRATRKAAFNGKENFYNYILKLYPDNVHVLCSVFRGRLKRKDGQFSFSEIDTRRRDILRLYSLRHGYSFEEVYPGKNIEERSHYGYYDVAIADLVFDREVVYDDVVDILDVANFLKDASVLANPRYLNHPKVSSRKDINHVIESSRHQLLRITEVKDVTRCQFFYLSKKTCQLFGEKEFWKTCNVLLEDAYSYTWFKDFLSRHDYRPLTLTKSETFITIHFTLENGASGCCMSKNWHDPEFYELLETDFNAQEASISK